MPDAGSKPKRLLIALGGNALIREGQEGSIEEQLANLSVPMRQIARLSREYRIIITHGNGPQVGNLLLQQECSPEVPRLPLEILVAQTQGQIGYLIESTLDTELAAAGLADQLLVSLISYIVVDGDDPAFLRPTKPVGPAYRKEQAAGLPFPMVETAKGFRRVVASPEPVTVVEKREINKLLNEGFIVICCGGGGIPVIREGRGFHGVDAVIDKDLASVRLAAEVGVDLFIIATDVPGVAIGFGTPQQRYIESLTIDDAARLQAEGHLPAGSMGPKVEAAVRFIRNGGQRAVICHLDDIEKAVAGKAGTRITV